MRLFRSPLFLLGLLVTIASSLMMIVLASRGFVQFKTILVTLLAGVAMMLVDRLLIRRSKWSAGRQLLVQALITITIIVLFLVTFRME